MKEVKCPECGADVTLDEEDESAECPDCGEIFWLEDDEDEDPPEESEE